MIRTLGFLLAGVLLGTPAYADLDLTFPGPATQTFSETENFASYKLPVGPYADGFVQTLVAEGQQITRAWRVDVGVGTSLLVMDNLRQQLEASGFELLYECTTEVCGGFDFRFTTEVLPEPVMHVDLGDFRYLAAQRLGGAVPEYVSLFVSRGADSAFVQMVLVGSADGTNLNSKSGGNTAQVIPAAPRTKPGAVVEALIRDGHAVLDDLEFETGSSALGSGEFSSLSKLSEYLKSNPEIRIALVGHTDAEGSLQGNIALSRQRAQSVAARLVRDFGIPQRQIEAEGVGYLAPRASNLTDEGRTLNRRVEVIITSTQS
ncbi:OmpA family protein [Litoreibacter arenae]|uniref:OmpA/MotB domain protein n=1 Tax=Litoreibacter arenae DSM 19593 TaxID=1123360 RepID=S9RHV9_9RHOB|nr:OmpA family protein [Litoreibacter arenae]EPX77670.1 OmpA/MotB domain protein [Litoreibacter arenae DSM 19593]